jgi:hypothetical protein
MAEKIGRIQPIYTNNENYCLLYERLMILAKMVETVERWGHSREKPAILPPPPPKEFIFSSVVL